MTNTRPYETQFNEPIDQDNKYVMEALAGSLKIPQSAPQFMEHWAHVRRSIQSNQGEVRWFITTMIQSTAPEMIEEHIEKQIEIAKRRVETVRKAGVSAYIQKHEHGEEYNADFFREELLPISNLSVSAEPTAIEPEEAFSADVPEEAPLQHAEQVQGLRHQVQA